MSTRTLLHVRLGFRDAKRANAIAVLGVLAAIAYSAVVSQPAAAVTLDRLTNDSVAQSVGSVRGDSILWDTHNAATSAFDLVLWDSEIGTTKSLPVSTPAGGSLCEGYVIYLATDGHDREVFAYNINSGAKRQLTSNEGDYDGFVVDGPWAVIESLEGTDWEISSFNARTGTVARLTDNTENDSSPAIEGDRVAWLSTAAGGKSEVFTQLLTGGAAKRLTNDSIVQNRLVVSGDKVVWLEPGSLFP